MKPFVFAFFIIILLFCSSCALQSDVRILEDRIITLEMHNMELQQLNYEAEREKKQIKLYYHNC